MTLRIFVFVGAFALLASSPLHANQEAKPESFEDLDEYVIARMEEWQVPGVAVGIIRDGEIVVRKCFGYRDVEAELPVTPSTQFAIGSCSKAFTAATVGMLVDDGAFGWTDPVADLIPGFAMQDSYATRHVSPRDLLVQLTGMPRHQTMFYGTGLSRAEVVAGLPLLEPVAPLRERHIYTNLMYVVAGYLVGQVSGGTWENFIRTRLFEPLGMQNTNCSVTEMRLSEDYAQPYVKPFRNWLGDRYRIEGRVRDVSAPAGGVNSSLDDMLKWVSLHLANGTVDGKQLLAPHTIGRMHRAETGLSYNPSGTTQYCGYGMGWFVDLYRGKYLVRHSGIVEGYCAAVAFLPFDGIGVVVLTNLKLHSLHDVLMRYCCDAALELEPADYNSYYLGVWADMDADIKATRAALLDTKVEGIEASPSSKECVGVYRHPAYGDFTVRTDGAGLAAEFNGNETVLLEHLHDNVWLSSHPELIYFDTLECRFDDDSFMIPLEGELYFTRE